MCVTLSVHLWCLLILVCGFVSIFASEKYNSWYLFFRSGTCYIGLLLLLFLCFFAEPVRAQVPTGFSVNLVQTNYTRPVGIAFSPDGNQFFIWEKSGKVWRSVWNGTTYVKQTTPVLDISEEVGDWNDYGLSSFCLDPNFSTNGLIYLFYQVDLHHLLYFGTPQYSPTANQYSQASISRVTRYQLTTTANTTTANYASRKILIGETISTGVPVTYETHGGGTLLFGRDGSLMLCTGDGAHHEDIDIGSRAESHYAQALSMGIMQPSENVGSFRSQLLNSLCGKVLRFSAETGNGLASNPFYDPVRPRAPQSRVWTLGLRHPFRMTLQPNTGSTNPDDANPGTLFVSEVGWFKLEEINRIDKPGLNCGWPVYEGLEPTIVYYGTNVPNPDEPGQPTFESLCLPPTSAQDHPNPVLRRFTHSRPLLDYSHSMAQTRVPTFSGSTPTIQSIGVAGGVGGTPFRGNCSIAGEFYTGTQFPETYQNTFFFADHGTNWIKNIVMKPDGSGTMQEVRDFSALNTIYWVIDMETNPRDGSLFCLSVANDLFQISYGGNQPPVARASSSVPYGPSPLSVNFTGAASTDPEGQSLTYLWDFGDGTTATTANPIHVYSSTMLRGYSASLVVTDPQGQPSLPKQIQVSVNNLPPTVQIDSPAPGTKYTMSGPTSYTLRATVTDANLTNMAYAWQVALKHNTHAHTEPVLTTQNPVITLAPAGCTGTETYYYSLSLTVTDNGGLTASTTLDLYPDCATASVQVSQLTATAQLRAARLNWVIPTPAFDELMVVARPETGFRTAPAGVNFSANTVFTGSGTLFEGGKVVYRGTGNTVTITDLNSLTRYFFRVFSRVGNTWSEGVETSLVPNMSPVAPAMPVQNAVPGAAFAYAVPAFNDPENQPLTYTAAGLPGWLSFVPNTRQLSGTPTATGTFSVTITAVDEGGLKALGVVVVQAGVCSPLASVGIGSWVNAAVWSCQRVPTLTDVTTVSHVLTLPTGVAGARTLLLKAGGGLRLGVGTQLKFGP